MTEWMTSEQMRVHLQLDNVQTVCRMAKRGDIPGVKLGRDWRFDPTEVDAHLKSTVVDPWVQSNRSRGRRRVV